MQHVRFTERLAHSLANATAQPTTNAQQNNIFWSLDLLEFCMRTEV